MPTAAAEQGRRARRAAADNRRDIAAVASRASSMSSSGGREVLWCSAVVRWTPAACGMVSSYVRPGTCHTCREVPSSLAPVANVLGVYVPIDRPRALVLAP